MRQLNGGNAPVFSCSFTRLSVIILLSVSFSNSAVRRVSLSPPQPCWVAGDSLFPQNDKKTPLTLANQGLIGIRQRLILPGRVQPSTFSTGELNFCVRDGNRWNLSVIATGNCGYFVSLSRTLTTAHRMILQTVPISSQFSVSDLLSLDFALLSLRSAILIFSFQALNEAFDRLVSSSYTPYSASTDDLSTW